MTSVNINPHLIVDLNVINNEFKEPRLVHGKVHHKEHIHTDIHTLVLIGRAVSMQHALQKLFL